MRRSLAPKSLSLTYMSRLYGNYYPGLKVSRLECGEHDLSHDRLPARLICLFVGCGEYLPWKL